MGLARTQEPNRCLFCNVVARTPGEPVDPDFPEIFNSESLELLTEAKREIIRPKTGNR